MLNQNAASFRKALIAAVCGASVLTLSACEKKAEGQVVAVIDGEEITLQQLNAELGAMSANQAEPDQQTRNAALARIVNRTLLAQSARKEGIDKSPEFVVREKMMEQNMLLQLLGEKVSRTVKKPSPQDISGMIAQNPQAFGERTAFALDQLVFPTPARGEVMQALAPVSTIEEAITVLNKFGVKFQRGSNTIDSGNLPANVFRQMKAVGTSEPIILPAGPNTTVAKIVAMKPIPLTPEQANQLAASAFGKQQVEKLVLDRLNAAKKEAKITYQKGFSAPPSTAASAAPAVGGAGAAVPAS